MQPWEKYASTSTQSDPLEAALELEGITGQQADIARSIYQQESSSGKNTKTSKAGARGGMQVIPATFNRMADKGWAIDNPVQNARAGVRYINTLYERAGGDPALTAAGYYGGEGAIDKAKRGIAVSDPRNPNAPNTLQYGQQVAARLPQQEQTAGAPWEKYSQAESAPQAQPEQNAYEATAQDQSFGENLLAGIGGGMYGMYLGGKDMLGLASEDEVVAQKAAMQGLNSTSGGFIGDVVGQTAIMLPAGAGAFGAAAKYIPKVAGLAGNLAGRTALAATGGATQGAFIPTTEDESRLGNVALGAAIGAGANQVLERGAKAIQKFALKRAATPAINNNIQVQIDNYLSSQGVDISQLSTAAKAKARQFAYQAMEAGTDAKPSVNQAVLDSLPVPMQGTKGQIGQDFIQQDSERVLADTYFGKPLRNRFEEQQTQLGQNLDSLIGNTKGTTVSIKDTGEQLQGEALKRYTKAKANTREAYKVAQDVAGDNIGKPSDNLIQWLDYNQGFKDVDGLITKAQKLGIVTKNDAGELVAGDAPLRNFYELRKTISQQSQNNGALAEAKGLVDDTFDAYGGDLYRKAAGLRRQQGVTFESGAKSVRDLVSLKNGTTDQAINREDVFNKVVINGNRDDIRNIKKLLLSGDRAERTAGKQQIENLKKQTLIYIKDASFTDVNGKGNFSLAQLEKAYKRIGDENLEEVLGKVGKAQLDDFMKAANIINRQQPRSAGNSATASRLANMAGSVFNVLEKLPVVGGTVKTVGGGTVKMIQASGATQNQMKAVTKKAIDTKAGKLAGNLSNSLQGSTFRTLGVASGQNLSE